MRLFFVGEWLCHRTWSGCELMHPLKVISGLSNKLLQQLAEDDLVWLKEDRKLYLEDLFDFMGIPRHRHNLFDVLCSETAQNQELQLVKVSDEVYFGRVYILIQRSCPCCPACQACCTRLAAHSLCSHGNFSHLWCRPRQYSGNNEPKRRKIRTVVWIFDCYINGAGLKTTFSDEEIEKELDGIKQEYGITQPHGFVVG